MHIRKANLDDVLNLAVLKQQVWIATYAEEGIRAEFSKYVLDTFTVDNIQKNIQDKNRIVLVAENDNHLVGCVEIALKARCPVENEANSPEITVLYVLERFIGKSIGKRLLEKAIEQIKEFGSKSTFLTVYHKNHKALEFYKRYGFKSIGSTNFIMDGNSYLNNILSLTF